jgi:hypothetical protein
VATTHGVGASGGVTSAGHKLLAVAGNAMPSQTPTIFHTVEKLGPQRPDFSTLWKNFARFFHTMEQLWGHFSTLWKNGADFFHTVEKWGGFFPRCGKKFSTLWKKLRAARARHGKRGLTSAGGPFRPGRRSDRCAP